MCELKGKCKDDFFSYFKENRRGSENGFYELLPALFQNALIIEFFDSKNINLHIEVVYDRSGGYVRGFDSEVIFIMHNDFTIINSDCLKEDVYETRVDATNSVIKKAIELYNMLHFDTNLSKN